MPTPVITNSQLGWATLSTVQSNIKPVSSFLRGLFFKGTDQYLPTESAELSYLEGHEKMAPFVEVNAEATSVEGNTTKFANVSCPNIRIKRPMEAYNVFLQRQPGTGIFVQDGGTIAAARNAKISEDQKVMSDMIERREEWMVSQMVGGSNASYLVLSYSVADGANFTVSLPRPSGSVASAGTTWASSTTIDRDFHNAKVQMAKSFLTPTDVVMGSTAASYFMSNAGVRTLLDNRNISAGALTLLNQFTEAGVIYLGMFCGIQCWSYIGEYLDDSSGAATAHVPAEVALFLNCTPANGSHFFYGAIPDHDAFEQGMFVGKRFSKAWKTSDPSSFIQLTHTRPLPRVGKPGAIYRLDITP